jgi:hypothetical protein
VTVATKVKAWDAMKKRADPLTSIALTIPVFLLYHLGILLVDRSVAGGVGADLVTDTVLGVLKASPPVYVVCTLTLALVVATVTWIEERRSATSGVSLSRVLLEGAGFGVVLLAAFGWATSRIMRTADPARLAELGVIDKLVLAAGSGFHQELIFRALMVTGFSMLLLKVFRLSKNAALSIAVSVSSVLFALGYNWGPHGEPFVADLAGMRIVLGALFAAIYLTRGFAIVVYAHAIFQALMFFVYA